MYSVQDNVCVQVEIRGHAILTCFYFFLRRAGLGGCLSRAILGLDGAVVRLVPFLAGRLWLLDFFGFAAILAPVSTVK